MKVTDACKSYFNGFQEVFNFNNNNNETSVLAVLKILSYFTVVIPLGFAAIYGGSLCGRANKRQELSEIEKRVNDKNPIRQESVQEKSHESIDPSIDSKAVVKNFLESIKTRASDADVFIIVSTDNAQPQLIKYSHFDNLFFPNTLFGADIDKRSTTVSVSNIRSMEIIPRIGSVMNLEDKEKLAKIGITFDKRGFINIPNEKFTCKKSVGSNNYHIKISSKEGIEIANINAKMSSHHSYCIVHWS